MKRKSTVVLSMLSLVALCVCSCAEPQPSPILPGVQRMPESAGADPLTPQAPGAEEARAALENHAAALEACRSKRPAFECSPMMQPPSPCDRPRAPVAASFTGLRPDALGAYYFDGKRCYQATEEEPGPCAMGAACHAWTTRTACEAARTICTGEGA